MTERMPLDWQTADALAACHGESVFLLDRRRLLANAGDLLSQFRANYPRTEMAYAYKANPLPAICADLAGMGLMAEVTTRHELQLAEDCGVPAGRVLFNGPARDGADMVRALRAGSLVQLDSLRDVRIAQAAAAATPGADFAVGLRASLPLPDLPPSRFGLDVTSSQFAEAIAGIVRTPGLRLAGLHCHVADRRVETFSQRARALVAVATQVLPDGPEYLDVGGNIYGGVPASLPGDHPQPSFADYARAVCDPVAAAYGRGADSPVLIMEPGTAVVATAMHFLTRVISVKRVGGRRVATVHGSLMNISPNTRRTDFPVRHLPASGARMPAADPCDVAGGSPLENDFLSFGLPMDLREGDFLVFDRVGAYSTSMAPQALAAPAPILGRTAAGTQWQLLPGTGPTA